VKIYLVLKETGSLQIWNQKSVVVRTQKEREDDQKAQIETALNIMIKIFSLPFIRKA